MVYKRSEYGLEYKKSHLVKNIPDYYDHVAYRTHRRELEHAHTPLSWDFQSDSKTSSEDDLADVPVQKLAISDKNDDNIKDKSDDLIQHAKEKLQKYESKDNQNTTDEKKDICKETESVLLKADEKENQCKFDLKDKIIQSKAEIKEEDKKDLKLNLKPDKDTQKKKIQRPKSSQRPWSSPVFRPPFLAYGCGDRERETGMKRSFNVRASADVYPAAMKALLNHHEKQVKREKAKKCLSARERKRKAVAKEKEKREVAGWQSEYRRMYPLYNEDEYARSASRIQDKPRAFRPYKF